MRKREEERKKILDRAVVKPKKLTQDAGETATKNAKKTFEARQKLNGILNGKGKGGSTLLFD